MWETAHAEPMNGDSLSPMPATPLATGADVDYEHTEPRLWRVVVGILFLAAGLLIYRWQTTTDARAAHSMIGEPEAGRLSAPAVSSAPQSAQR